MKRFRPRGFLLRFFVLAALALGVTQAAVPLIGKIDPLTPAALRSDAPRVTPARARHILDGDATGGGHRSGANKPCKSEFPAHLDDGEIIALVARTAANDNLDWKKQRNGYEAADARVDGLRLRVVVDRRRGEVVTAYPLGVRRNPCPSPANDP